MQWETKKEVYVDIDSDPVPAPSDQELLALTDSVQKNNEEWGIVPSIIEKAVQWLIQLPDANEEATEKTTEKVKDDFQMKEIFAKGDQPLGTYLYLSTRLDLDNAYILWQLQEKIQHIPTDTDVYVRPMWEKIDANGLDIRWWYICSNNDTWYRPMIQYVIWQDDASTRLRDQILSFGLAQDIPQFKDCFLDDSNRGLILHRTKANNKHRYSGDAVIELLRVVSVTK